MPRSVSSDKRAYAVDLMLNQNMGQRDIERETGLSRPYLRKLAGEVGYKFPQNGVELVSKLCMCANCGAFFRRPPSKISRAKSNLCSKECRQEFMKGSQHGQWKGGVRSKTFSEWIANQSGYQKFRNDVLERAGNKCEISGLTTDLDVHHILLKSVNHAESLNPDNGLVLNKEIHREIHKLIHEGKGFEESVQILKDKYSTKKE